MQRVSLRADWDVHGLDNVWDYVIEDLGDPEGVLIVDETGFIKKDTHSAVQRQYSSTAGRKKNYPIPTFVACAPASGHASIHRELYLPRTWTGDRARCRAVGLSDEVGFAIKPQQIRAMIERAVQAGTPSAWGAEVAAYGQAGYLRTWLAQEDVAHVPSTNRNDTLTSGNGARLAPTSLPDNADTYSACRCSIRAVLLLVP